MPPITARRQSPWQRNGSPWPPTETTTGSASTLLTPGARNTTWCGIKILGFNLFPKKVREAEMAYYLTKLNTYGLPLDYRADYTKLDWSVWTATLADDPKQFNALIDPIYKWTNETPDRVPLSDWYDTKTGKHISFQARSVVGGVFIKALAEKQIVAKWNKFSSQ